MANFTYVSDLPPEETPFITGGSKESRAANDDKLSGGDGQENKKDWSWTSSLALCDESLPPMKAWLSPVIFEGSGTVINGSTGAGKTMFGLGMARALVKGENFGPYQSRCAASCVLYLDYELGRHLMRRRLSSFKHEQLHVICRDSPELGEDGLLPLDTPDGQEQVEKFIEALKPDVFFIDTCSTRSWGNSSAVATEIAR